MPKTLTSTAGEPGLEVRGLNVMTPAFPGKRTMLPLLNGTGAPPAARYGQELTRSAVQLGMSVLDYLITDPSGHNAQVSPSGTSIFH